MAAQRPDRRDVLKASEGRNYKTIIHSLKLQLLCRSLSVEKPDAVGIPPDSEDMSPSPHCVTSSWVMGQSSRSWTLLSRWKSWELGQKIGLGPHGSKATLSIFNIFQYWQFKVNLQMSFLFFRALWLLLLKNKTGTGQKSPPRTLSHFDYVTFPSRLPTGIDRSAWVRERNLLNWRIL